MLGIPDRQGSSVELIEEAGDSHHTPALVQLLAIPVLLGGLGGQLAKALREAVGEVEGSFALSLVLVPVTPALLMELGCPATLANHSVKLREKAGGSLPLWPYRWKYSPLYTLLWKYYLGTCHSRTCYASMGSKYA